MRLLSFGGGVQTTALAILVVRGEVAPVDHIVMSDTGGETPETYSYVAMFARWLQEHGLTLHVVHENGPTLEDWTLTRSTPIPVMVNGGLGKRQCTNLWKIRPVKRFARQHGAKALDMLLGISWDEIHRVKPSREKWVTRSYPLVDLRMSRSVCREVVAHEGLPEPPKSACWFCPFQRADRWRWLAFEHPELFDRAQAMEAAINARLVAKGKEPNAYMTSNRVPLHRLIRADDMLPGFGFENECEGVCDV